MFGFIIGAVSLFGLIKVLKHGHHGHDHRQGRDARRRRWMFRWLFEYLDTTPGQEKVFQAAAEDLEGRARQMREELETLRRDVAKALVSPTFDPASVRESFAKQRAHLDTLEEAVIGHLGKVHEALDEQQRARAAELLEEGPHAAMRCGRGWHGRHGRWHHGYRHAHWKPA
ncbi:MAG: periplasmic heavy metal sensor [Myxococcaceae bacterium]|nr:periplasmic heavy metal sensor [Myxococcaceae bacterium]